MRTTRDYAPNVAFAPGDRVALSPASDWFMRGAKYGEVHWVSTTYVHVWLEVAGQRIPGNSRPIHPDNLERI